MEMSVRFLFSKLRAGSAILLALVFFLSCPSQIYGVWCASKKLNKQDFKDDTVYPTGSLQLHYIIKTPWLLPEVMEKQQTPPENPPASP